MPSHRKNYGTYVDLPLPVAAFMQNTSLTLISCNISSLTSLMGKLPIFLSKFYIMLYLISKLDSYSSIELISISKKFSIKYN